MAEKTFFGHPRSLGTLFHLELWERFSYYGMQAILLIYLYYQTTEGGLGIDQTVAGGIVGAYSGSIYLATIVGGWLADRVWGAERTQFWSGMMIMSGHIALALVPGVTGLILGLLLVALGTGGLKPCASSMVGSLYEDEKTRPLRDAGFSIFYVAINIGGFLGPLLVGLLQETKGFHYGFGAAAVGMAVGLFIYSRGRQNLGQKQAPHPLKAAEKQKIMLWGTVAVVAIALALWLQWVTVHNFSKILLCVILLLSAVYFIRLYRAGDDLHKKYVLAYLPLFATICIFWSLWFQIYTVVTVYFDETMNRTIAGFEIPVGWMASLQSFWVVSFSGVMAAIWTKLGTRQPKTATKFAWSLIIAGLGYACFLPFMGGASMPLWVFALAILVLTIAELFISPISLSLATKIAPAQFKTQMVSLNFLAFSLGFTLGGTLFKTQYNEADPAAFYEFLTITGVAGGVALLLCMPWLNRLLDNID